jgi:hypothetical protein
MIFVALPRRYIGGIDAEIDELKASGVYCVGVTDASFGSRMLQDVVLRCNVLCMGMTAHRLTHASRHSMTRPVSCNNQYCTPAPARDGNSLSCSVTRLPRLQIAHAS